MQTWSKPVVSLSLPPVYPDWDKMGKGEPPHHELQEGRRRMCLRPTARLSHDPYMYRKNVTDGRGRVRYSSAE